MGVVDLEYKLDRSLTLNEFKSIYNFLKSYFYFENFTKLGISNAILQGYKVVNLENHFYTAKLEKRYEQYFSNYDKYNDSWNHYEDDKRIIDFYYYAVSHCSITFVFVDKEKRIQEDSVLRFNEEFVKLFKSFNAKLTKGEWHEQDLACLFIRKTLIIT